MEKNPVKKALRIVGGSTASTSTAVAQVAVVCGVSVTTVYNWIASGRVSDSRHAVLLSEKTLAEGQPMTVRELAGMADTVPSGPRGKKGDAHAGRAFQTEAQFGATHPSQEAESAASTLVVEAVDRAEPTVRKVASIQRERQRRRGVPKRPRHVLQGLTAMLVYRHR